MRKIQAAFILAVMVLANSICQAACGEAGSNFEARAFKGHAVFVWKESSGYSFAWLPDTNALVPRERVSAAPPDVPPELSSGWN
ncbi:MAG: hypothetical protein LBB65_00750 [Burkholderiales bacterium]|jgi:hypothetical protein|nr:hypothetical protein [Burkholderiales bacterium]